MEYEYNPLGQLARKRSALVNRDQYLVPSSEQNTKNQELNTKAASTAFFWDGLALLQRGDESYLTEGHVSGGIPVNVSREVREGTQREQATQESSSFVGQAARLPEAGSQGNGTRSATGPVALQRSVVVSDFLGTTLGTVSGEKFAPVYLTAFGEQIASPTPSKGEDSEINSGFGIQDSEFSSSVFYTGKHYDEDLQAYHFLYRNYSPTQARWTAADPSGFPDGPNQWLYVNNGVMNKVDALGLFNEVLFTGGAATALTGLASTTAGIIGLINVETLGVTQVLGAVAIFGGFYGIQFGMAAMVGAFNDTTTWIPKSVGDVIGYSLAEVIGASNTTRQAMMDLANLLQGAVDITGAASAAELALATAQQLRTTTEALSGVRDLIEATNEEGTVGYE